MPLYDYRCRTCQESFALREKIEDHGKAEPVCPKCKSTDVERVISPSYAKTVRKS
jgi:putative FmdB family regulatory protein